MHYTASFILSNQRKTIPSFLLIVILITCSFARVLAQLVPGNEEKNPFKVNLIPPSPEAAALAKYADIPVSLYSGTPQIAVPLYEIQERELSLPIILSYHASGNKVGTEASRTGLGFSLDAGGVITRAVRGWPDEFTPRGFLFQSQQHEISDFALGTKPAQDQYEWYQAMAEGCKDMEPDIFYFNFAGYSGKFMFNWDGEIEIASASSLKIVPLGMNAGTADFIDGWEVRAEDGTVFIFDQVETTRSVSGDPFPSCLLTLQDALVPSAWYIREIRPADQPTWIRFDYEPYTQTTDSWSLETQTHHVSLSPAIPSRQKVTLTTNGIKLRRITTSSGQTTVDFLNGTQRSDVIGNCYTLGEVIVKNSRNRIIKDWKFAYDYSTGRLTLKKLTEWSAANTTKPPYEFSYYGGGLPGVASFSQDHWGFLNNNSVNTLIPAITIAAYGYSDPISLSGANREPSENGVLASMLKEIIYPTGGKDILEFEPHDYSFEQNTELVNDVTNHKSFSADAPRSGTPAGQVSKIEVDFVIEHEVEEIKIEGAAFFGVIFGGGGFNPTVAVINKTTSQELWSITPAEEDDDIFKILKKVPPGQYALIVKVKVAPPNLGGQNSISATLTFDEPTGEFYTEIKKGGGVRIAKMTRVFGNGNPDKVTQYIYRITEKGLEKSSGSLLESGYEYAEGMHYMEATSGGEPTFNFPLAINKWVRFSQNRCTLGTTQGSHVGYCSVTVLQGESGENGKTVYTYTSPREVADYSTFEVPYPPATSYDYQRGLLLQQDDYNSSGVLQKRVHHEYGYQSKTVYALKVGFKVPGVGPFGALWLFRYALGNYQNILGYTRAKATHEQLFYPGSGGAVESSQKFVYNENPNHRQLTLVVTTDSKKDSLFNKMIYPQDYASGVQAIDLMKSRHQVNSVVEKVFWKKSGTQLSLLSAIKTDFTVRFGKILPSALHGSRVSNPVLTNDPVGTAQTLYEERLQYINYDSYGNLIEHALKNGARTAYLWGESGTVVLAKADHATSGQIFHTSFEEDTQGVTTYQKTGRKSKAITNATYAIPAGNLPLIPGKYILSYWIRQGITWQYREKTIDNYQPGNAIATEIINGHIDDVRLYPFGALMTTFAYEPLVGITSITDVNNKTLYFEYDDFNRLKCKRDDDKNILECYDYRYQEEIQYAVENNLPDDAY